MGLHTRKQSECRGDLLATAPTRIKGRPIYVVSGHRVDNALSAPLLLAANSLLVSEILSSCTHIGGYTRVLSLSADPGCGTSRRAIKDYPTSELHGLAQCLQQQSWIAGMRSRTQMSKGPDTLLTGATHR
jgi:hypothetical protein